MYNYEYKQKNGFKSFGKNLETIVFSNDCLKLYGTDVVYESSEIIKYHWHIILNLEDLVYFKFSPMAKEN